jgi:hypothetical protein
MYQKQTNKDMYFVLWQIYSEYFNHKVIILQNRLSSINNKKSTSLIVGCAYG